jgi:hypothetical protein
LGPVAVYGTDHLFVVLRMAGARPGAFQEIGAILAAGHPVLSTDVTELSGIGQEFFLWEFAVAAAGSILGIHPFDQPDVQYAKDLDKRAMESKESQGAAPKDMLGFSRKDDLSKALSRLLGSVRPGDYLAIQAYLAPALEISARIEAIRNHLRGRLHVATTTGFGPRFLHSTGQLHKGGPNNGVFIQLTDEITEDVSVPEKTYTFGTLIRAQAEGDYEALKSRGRRIARINLGGNAAAGLEQLELFLHD